MTEYDTLRIKIVANAGTALDTVKRFSDRLEELQKKAEKLDFTRILKLEEILRDIANIDLTKVSNGLYSVAKSFETLAGAASKGATALSMNEVGEMVAAQMEKLASTTKTSTEKVAKSLSNVSSNVPLLVRNFEDLKDIKFGRDLEKTFDTMAGGAIKAAQGIKDLKVYSDQLYGKSPFEIMGRDAKNFYNEIQRFKELQGIKISDVLGGQRDLSFLEQFKTQTQAIGENFIKFDSITRNITANLEKMSALTPIEKLGKALNDIGLNGTQAESVIKTIGQETNKFSDEQIEDVKKAMEELGYSADQVKLTLSKLGKESDKTTKKINNGLNKVAIKFKSLALYRVLRLALMKIQQEFQTAIQNLALKDAGFNEAISNLSNSFTYLANSIMAMLSPIIQVLTPFITMLSDLVSEITNSLGSLFSSAIGKNQFTEATKGAEDYAESLKKAKNVSLGIDELNVIKKDEGAGLFQTKDIETSNELGNIIKELKKELEPIIEKVREFFKALEPIIQFIFKLVGKFLDQTDETVNQSVGAFIDALINIVSLIDTILQALEPILDLVNVILSLGINLLNEGLTELSNLISFIVDLIKPIIHLLEPIIAVISLIADLIVGLIGGALEVIFGIINTIVEFVIAIGETLVAIFTLDFDKLKQIWENFGERVKDIWKGVGNFFVDILNGMIGAVEKFINFFVKGVGKIAELFGADTSNWGVHIERIQHFSTGGFPEDGLFLANHNELVGKFSNGKTAVANNEQITEGIYRAVKEALSDSTSENTGEIIINLDGNQIAKVVNNYNSQKGADNLFVGGKKYGW